MLDAMVNMIDGFNFDVSCKTGSIGFFFLLYLFLIAEIIEVIVTLREARQQPCMLTSSRFHAALK